MSTTNPPSDTSILNLTPYAKQVEAHLHTFLDNRPMGTHLRSAIKYTLLDGGKRLRPALTLITAQAITTNQTLAITPAAAIEMIHCFSLIHDDLPSMDDDDLRRGKPTLHKKYNEATAVLAGDMLQGLAIEIINQELPAAMAQPISLILSSATNDMIVGQVYDTLQDFPEGISDIEKLELIHHNKTGALITAACQMGAITAEATPEQFNAITEYSQAIGLMFQVVDDILDVTQSTEVLGKTAGKDAEQNKLTYPAILGMEASKQKVLDLEDQAQKALSEFNEAAEPLRLLVDALATRQK